MRLWIIAAAVNGFLAVALGALAAHGLQDSLPVEALVWIETGARLGLAHGLALLGVGLLMGRAVGPSRALAIAGWGFLVGTPCCFPARSTSWDWRGGPRSGPWCRSAERGC